MKTKLKTQHKQGAKAIIRKTVFNLFPSYRRSGGRVCYISDNWKEVHIKLRYSWKTRNYVGSVFGGSIYAALDPTYMVQLICILGKNYVVWDKDATVKFIKPIKKTVYARFLISEEILQEIKETIEKEQKGNFVLQTQFEDAEGTVYALVEKTIYIADKDFYSKRQLSK
jgi:acyl-coenzyme A thioesterase PaaI-like protein